jgi:CRP-like cAMP-binding protein
MPQTSRPRAPKTREAEHVLLLEAVPELAEHLGPEQAPAAHAQLSAPVVQVPRGRWVPADLAGRAGRPFGAIVISGLMTRHVDIGGHPGLDLYGPGDLVPARELRRATLPAGESWRMVAGGSIAVLDDRFLVAARRWPRLVSGLLEKAQDQHDRLLVQLVVAEQPRVEDRLLLLFWHLSDRYGRVTPDGIVLPLDLTHEALGQLIGARRPTVTLALKLLLERGAIARRPDRAWVVLERPDDAAVTASALPAAEL